MAIPMLSDLSHQISKAQYETEFASSIDKHGHNPRAILGPEIVE
jgi:hypothetical protein